MPIPFTHFDLLPSGYIALRIHCQVSFAKPSAGHNKKDVAMITTVTHERETRAPSGGMGLPTRANLSHS